MEWEAAGNKGSQGAPGGLAKGKKKLGCLAVIAIVVVLVLVSQVSKCASDAPQDLNWPSTGLATKLPEPPTNKGEVSNNTDEVFWADVANCSEKDYEAYVEKCKEKGFTVEGEKNSLGYEAYSGEGYKLRVTYSDSSEEMGIELDAPEEMGEFSWPTSGPGALVPAPASTSGKIVTDSSDSFAALVSQTDRAAYGAYVDSCISAGFDVDYNKGDETFSAENAAGTSLSVRYEGFNTMRVSVSLPDETVAEPEPVPAPAEPIPAEPESVDAPAETADTSGVTPDFREMVDGYEAFMNEYVDFMLTYNSSDNVLAMALDYADMMSKYSDWASRIDELDESTLSAADSAYYLAAQGRVLQRLSEIGQ